MKKSWQKIYKICMAAVLSCFVFTAAFSFTACAFVQDPDTSLEQGGNRENEADNSAPVDNGGNLEKDDENNAEDDNNTDEEEVKDNEDNEERVGGDDQDESDDENDGSDDIGDDQQPVTNAYANIVSMLESIRGSEILTLDNYYGFLSFYEKTDNRIILVLTDLALDTENLVESAKNIKEEDILKADIFESNSYYIGYYRSDSEDAENAEMVTKMLNKLLGLEEGRDYEEGKDYKIIFGTVSQTVSGGIGRDGFSVYAIYEKDGGIYIYSVDVNANNTVYDTSYEVVLRGNESLYYLVNETLTDLGTVAADYYAECKKVAEAGNENG